MKLFSFILSIAVFFVALYFFFDKLPIIDTFDDMIYISLLVILLLICITGVFINWEVVRKRKNSKVILFVSNSFSKKDKKSKAQ